MTTIITRAYGDRGKADAAAQALLKAGYASDMIDVIDAGEGLSAAMRKAEVSDEVATAYAGKMKEGQAALVARIPFFPIGAAKTAMEIVDGAKPLKVEVPKRDDYVRTDGTRTKRKVSVDTEHKLFLSGGKPPGNTISEIKFWAQKVVPYKHLSDRKPRADSLSDVKFWARKLVPYKHLSERKPRADSLSDVKFWAQKVVPYKHLSERKPPDNCIDRGGHWATRIIDVPLIISR
ncbi:MAG: hypothetical protein AAF763_03900 [Pseudomonadota bacterium]